MRNAEVIVTNDELEQGIGPRVNEALAIMVKNDVATDILSMVPAYKQDWVHPENSRIFRLSYDITADEKSGVIVIRFN